MNARVVDLFCGAGGLTRGFADKGFDVVAGIDLDESAKFAYEHNNDATFYCKDIRDVSAKFINDLFADADYKILVGCAPCQSFSSYTQGLDHDDDQRWELLDSFAALVKKTTPHVVSMENVSRVKSHDRFTSFVETLKDAGYQVWYDVVACADYGVPQTRRRLVLLASRLGPIELVEPTHKKADWRTVEDTIKGLELLQAGGTSKTDPLHKAAGLTERGKDRLKASKPGSTWKAWPEKLRAKCHRKVKCKSYVSVYGRMEWKKPAPTLTTQFFGIGHGRYGHPSQLRAISLREGALLQTFPSTYAFGDSTNSLTFATIGRLIGNAVPVNLAKAIADSIALNLKAVKGSHNGSEKKI